MAATLTFDATQTFRSMTLSVSNVHMPDGMIMSSRLQSNGLTEPGAYYPVEVVQVVGDTPLGAGHISISGTTANGDHVPLFGTNGTIAVHAVNPVTGANLGVVVSGFYNTAVKGGGGGHP